MSENTQNQNPKQEQYSLNDDRRVKVLSPGALVAKRFFRNRLAVVGLSILVAMFLFDWVMGLVCLIPVAVSLFAMWWMMGRDVPEGGRYFMQRYQEALNRMSTAATEYVRGIPVVKVFQQTVHSFRAFHAAIVDYRDMATTT